MLLSISSFSLWDQRGAGGRWSLRSGHVVVKGSIPNAALFPGLLLSSVQLARTARGRIFLARRLLLLILCRIVYLFAAISVSWSVVEAVFTLRTAEGSGERGKERRGDASIKWRSG